MEIRCGKDFKSFWKKRVKETKLSIPRKREGEEMETYHTPVLLREVIDFLQIAPGKKYIDATLGGGGHAEEILKHGGQVLGIDWDPEAIEHVGSKDNLTLVKGNFKDLKEIALSNNFNNASGILFDLGVSTHQLLTPSRGFSFRADVPLDMRMSPDLKVTAADLINGLRKGELYELFSKLGEEHDSRVPTAIVRARAVKPIITCRDLAELIVQAKGEGTFKKRVHPATKVFQALRIAVNGELENLKIALPQAVEVCGKGGRLIVISFHSLEDRIVKDYFKMENQLKILTKHPMRPTAEEVRNNPRSQSAKLRVAEKI